MTSYTINCKSRMSKGMELNEDILSGDTYNARQYIKEYWDGKWNGSSKTWTVNPEKVITTIQEQKWGFAKVLSIVEKVPARISIKKVHGVNGWCNKCHSYCYGDCEA